jgi:RimJ/RimL family protein N-acetyltransferase
MPSSAPPIETARLQLRGFEARDLDDYAAMCADAEVMRFVGDGGPLAREAAWRQMALFAGHWPLRGFGTWAVEERTSGRLVGRVGYLQPEGWPGVELGWLLARPAWGRGLATEACRAALAQRAAFGIGRLISLVRPGNLRSAALAQRLGARLARTVDFLGAPVQVWEHAHAAGAAPPAALESPP